ncbi:unnamed protein product [Prorocentrum cordatum]|uniref:Uncharacterized protein n=1 Tax=Prorocentrum cordatum TaxID=2364126 RepID=A0ABN9YHC6_9DINO|nr:unnamed protein product [Polarella glacialis]
MPTLPRATLGPAAWKRLCAEAPPSAEGHALGVPRPRPPGDDKGPPVRRPLARGPSVPAAPAGAAAVAPWGAAPDAGATAAAALRPGVAAAAAQLVSALRGGIFARRDVAGACAATAATSVAGAVAMAEAERWMEVNGQN